MSNKIDLSGKKAVVTGGAQGIGRAVVERFLDSGAAVAIWDRDKKLSEKTAEELKSRGRVAAIAVDVTSFADIERARDDTVKALGGIDILINNAGIAGPTMKMWEVKPEDWAQTISVNLDSQFYCCKAIVPLMIAQKYGRIVNVASIAGKEGNPNARAVFGVEGRRDRADQVARQGTGELRYRRELRDAGGGEDRDLRADHAGAYRLHALEDSARAFRQGRGGGGTDRVLRLRRLLVHDRGGV